MSRSPQTVPRHWPWWHLIGIWAVVVAQPLLDVLRRNGDFFVAHRASPVDLILFSLVLLVVLPALVGLAIRALGAAWAPLGRAVHVVVVGILLAAMSSQIAQRFVDLPTWPHLFVAGALGALGAWAYAASPGIRWCASALVAAAPVFGGMFLMHPNMEPFVNPLDRTRPLATAVPPGSPPIVMVVFDQLPVSSLLTPDGAIDARHFPGFAALASASTWFRNATANGEYTGWALPAIMTGRLPRPSRLPISQHHPQNLFSVVAEAYRFEVTEPITRLCPERLCPADDGPMWQRLLSMLLDSAVVYGHIVSPLDVRLRLPALTDDWRDFARADQWQGRWVRARDRDRTEPVGQFIDSISASDPQPTMYFLHVLLPHEPYVYLRSGQRFATETRNPGLSAERWDDDAYLVSLGYARHLTQLEFVDGVVARLVAKLRSEGLFDRSILVVTSDHGASFRPGHPWKGLDEANRADIMGVPLFIKAPGQSAGRTDLRNAQAIDVLPTVAELLHVSLREQVDGHSALGPAPADTRKRIRHSGASRETVVDVADHERALLDLVSRRWSQMPDGVRPVPEGTPRQLLDTPVAGNTPDSELTVLVEGAHRFADVNLKGPVLPLYLQGRVLDADGNAVPARLAIAVNGVVRALARTATRGQAAQEGEWCALLPASSLKAGRNVVQVLVIDRAGRPQLAFSSGERPESLNLSSNAATEFWGIAATGFHPREKRSGPAFRWTRGEASLVIPMNVEPRPHSIRIGLIGPPYAGGPVRIRLEDCTLHDGPIESAPWHRSFSLDACPAAMSAREVHLVFQSATAKARDGREVGVPVESVNMFAAAWPAPPAKAADLRGVVTSASGPSAVARSTPAGIDVVNAGHGIWSDGAGESAVALALAWRRMPDGSTDTSQQLRLPIVAYPGESMRVELPLVPPASVDGPGPWEVTLTLVMTDGTPVPIDHPLVLAVTASRAR